MIQSDLQIKFNPNKILRTLFTEIETNYHKIHMESKENLDSRSQTELKEQSWIHHIILL